MANYRYKIYGEDIVLSPEEHQVVQRQIATGQHSLITFRRGSLGVNTQFISFFKQTDHLTTEEEMNRQNVLKLGSGGYIPPTAEDIARRKEASQRWKSRMWKPI